MLDQILKEAGILQDRALDIATKWHGDQTKKDNAIYNSSYYLSDFWFRLYILKVL